jgi:predicted ABC-type ATPase
VVIHQSIADIPEPVKQSALSQGYPLSSIKGFTHNRQAHIVADNVESVEDARNLVVAHELTHLGQDTAIVTRAVEFFRKTTDPQYKTLLNEVAKDYGHDLKTGKGYEEAVKEATARFAERGETGRLWNALRLELRTALRKLGLKLEYTETDLRGIASAMMRNADRKIRGGAGERAIQFSLKRTDAEEMARLEDGYSYGQGKSKITKQAAAEEMSKFKDPGAIINLPDVVDARIRSSRIPVVPIKTTDEARLDWRDKTIAEMYQTGVEKDGSLSADNRMKGRRMDIVLGLPGAGKTSVIGKSIKELYKPLEIDADIIKEKTPEFAQYGGIAAHAVHKESAYMAEKMLLPETRAHGDNILFTALGKDADKILDIIAQSKAKGYEVYVHHVEVPAIDSMRRAVTRYRFEGRFVDPAMIGLIRAAASPLLPSAL